MYWVYQDFVIEGDPYMPTWPKNISNSAGQRDCALCSGEGIVLVRPGGHGHANDLAEYEPS